MVDIGHRIFFTVAQVWHQLYYLTPLLTFKLNSQFSKTYRSMATAKVLTLCNSKQTLILHNALE